MTIRTLIIDDEPMAQKGLEDYIKEAGFLQLVAKAEDAAEAFEVLSSEKIDLIFLDIQMPKMSGISFLEKLKIPPMVIICSAYSDYALQGFELAVLDYLLKPVSYERFQKSAVRAKAYFALSQNEKLNFQFNDDHFYIKSNNKIEKVNLRDLLYLEALGNYVMLHTNTNKHIAYVTLKSVDEYLPKERFIRIHKTFLVPLDKIQSIGLDEVTIEGKTLPLSRNYRDELLKRIHVKLWKR